MRKPQETQPADVSKTVFMDMAFLLIAALVLLVREPLSSVDVAATEIRSVAVTKVVEKDIPGESLFLRVAKDRAIEEMLANNTAKPIAESELQDRVAAMRADGDRVVVLFPDADVPYSAIAKIRDALVGLKDRGTITQLYEVVRIEP